VPEREATLAPDTTDSDAVDSANATDGPSDQLRLGCTAFRTVVADPPWPGPIGDWRSTPLLVQPHSLKEHGRKAPGNVYKLMSIEAIEACSPLTAPKAHLWLWALPQHVDWAYRVARCWGFAPLHLIAWAKPGFGTGGFQANTEYVLIARKGGPKDNAFGRMAGTHFSWPRTSTHSAKPTEFFSLVESVSPGPYLEMFARGSRAGWSSWGDEATDAVSGCVSSPGTPAER
jgi:N6-adenosine-specific RNA methylase IME4